MADWKAWWLAQTPGWGAVRLRQLIECIGSEQQILDLLGVCEGPEQLQQWIQTGWMESEAAVYGESLKIKAVDVRRLWEHRLCQNQKKEEYEHWMEKGIRFITLYDPDYPGRLRQLYDPPYALYVRGNLPREDRKSAAVIGARACSNYGTQQGRRLARELAMQGVQIISGLALGVDSEGHWGALESGASGATFAILGCGVDICYPAEHEKLAERILEQGGGLLSEFPMGTQPLPRQFPMRNRIISGLSDCILVIEARKRSGSLITVDQALEQGREVFALPGRVGDSLSEGCLHLIRNGANVLMESGDVLSYLYHMDGVCGDDCTEKPANSTENGGLDTGGVWKNGNDSTGKHAVCKNAVYSVLDCAGKTMEEIVSQTNLPLEQVRAQLLELILEDQILETVKGYYSLRL